MSYLIFFTFLIGSVDEVPRRQSKRPAGRKHCKVLKDTACALTDSDSSDEDNPAAKEHLKPSRQGSNWRESGIQSESLPAKRGRGRPKGSKNKTKQSSQQKSSTSPNEGKGMSFSPSLKLWCRREISSTFTNQLIILRHLQAFQYEAFCLIQTICKTFFSVL